MTEKEFLKRNAQMLKQRAGKQERESTTRIGESLSTPPPSHIEVLCSRCGGVVGAILDHYSPPLCQNCQDQDRVKYEQWKKEQALLDKRGEREGKVQHMKQSVAATIPPIFYKGKLKARLFRLNPTFRAQCIAALDGPGLVLYGPTGTGKSYAMCALLRLLICRHGHERHTTKRIGAEMLNLEIRDAFKRDSNRSELDVIRPYMTPDVLLLEDLGAGKSVGATESDFAVRVVYVLLDNRIEQGQLTLITTNKTRANLAKSFDDRIASRLSVFAWIGVGGHDKRGER